MVKVMAFQKKKEVEVSLLYTFTYNIPKYVSVNVLEYHCFRKAFDFLENLTS